MRLRCDECGTFAEADSTGWRIFLGVGDEDDYASTVLCVFCPDCAEREFGAGRGMKLS